VTPSGKLLASWNTRSIPKVLEQLDLALERWRAMEPEQRMPEHPLPREARPSDAYPQDGLALVVYTRDMPREDLPEAMRGEWRRHAWNQDRFWLRKEELDGLREGKGLPPEAAKRLVQIHGRDNVRGQSPAYEAKQVVKAEVRSRVLEASETRVVVELSGEGAVAQSGVWSIDDRRDGPAEHTRSFEGTLGGRAVWEGGRWTEFQLAWVGTRQGATQFNGRSDDPGPAPMGVVLVLAPENDRIAPSFAWMYGWR